MTTATMNGPIIKLLTDDNPKQPKSRARRKFDILMRYNGKPIEAFKSEEGKHPTLDKERGWTTNELWWAKKLGLIKFIKSRK